MIDLLGTVLGGVGGGRNHGGEDHVHDENCIPDEILRKPPYDKVQLAKNVQRLLGDQANQLGDMLVVIAISETIQSALVNKLEVAEERIKELEKEDNEEREADQKRIDNLEERLSTMRSDLSEERRLTSEHQATIRRLNLELEDAKKLIAPLPTADEPNDLGDGASNVS